ncbi:MAG TPA: efflux RND transporter periplasmic adaptor subunit [Vicinamibacterales bacterium]|jgi:multidrug efflux system membrane fusion protein|nr:efflux RND transporter periplasmic adaptor subunit [Vicinamibacterales bacterium]
MNASHNAFLKTPATRVALLVAALASTAAIAACTRTSAEQAPPPPPQVTVAPVLERAVTEWDEFTGRLQAVDSVDVRPRVSGFVSAVRFSEGAMVHRGDVLFQIDPRPFQTEVDRLRAELDRAHATVARANSELGRAERLRSENAMSSEERDRRASFAQESAAQVAAVEAGLRAAELNLEFTRVTSPIDGRVSRAIVTEGNLVSSGPGEATLLTTIVSLDPVYAYFDADEQIFLKYMAAGGKGANRAAIDRHVQMALANEEGFPHEGRLDFLDNQVDPSTGTIRGRAVFRNTDGQLTPGLFIRLRLAGTGSYDGLLIQDRAVGTDLSKKFVYVVSPKNEIEYRPVTLGPIVNGLRVVRDGLKAGEPVVVDGLQRIRPGARVQPVTAN